MFLFDSYTAILFVGMLYILLSVFTWISLINQRSYPITLWCVGGLLIGLSFITHILQVGNLKWSASLLIFSATFARIQSLLIDQGRPWRTHWIVIAIILLYLGFQALYFFVANQVLRAQYFNAVNIGLFSYLGILAWQISCKEQSLNAKWIAIVYGIVVGVFVVRTFALLGKSSPNVYLLEGDIGKIFVISSMVSATIGHFGYIGLALDRSRRREIIAIAEINDQRLALQIKQSRLEERSRLLEDIHDGFGSQLISARLMIEHEELSQSQTVELLGDCLGDLRLVVDLLSGHDNDLATILINYRHRLSYRMSNMPAKLIWAINLEPSPMVSERTALQILRIVQEAITNALKHANPNSIWITISCLKNETLTISICDDGIGLPEPLKKNRGLINMEKRAKDIGATLDVLKGNKGTTVLLTLKQIANPDLMTLQILTSL
ncbi:MAG: ATP-binding protein [Methylococcaceae bacterium]